MDNVNRVIEGLFGSFVAVFIGYLILCLIIAGFHL